MQRDLAEQLEEPLIHSPTMTRVSKGFKHLLKQTFLESPLQPLKNFLNGTWLGHPLHPVVTDVPVGAWTTALSMDALTLMGVPGLEQASGIATGLGVLGAVAAAGTGVMDYTDVGEPERNVALTHGVINTVATAFFTVSFLGRWQNGWRTKPWQIMFSGLGYATLVAGAYFGGSLVFRHGTMVNRNAFREGPEDFVNALSLEDLPESTPKRVMVKGEPILFVRHGERIYAIGAVCSHLGGPLEEGEFKGTTVTCPWHYSVFSLKDGAYLQGPTTAPVPAYRTRVQGGKVQVMRRPE